MTGKTISIGEAYKSGWTSFKSNIGLLVTILAIVVAVNFALGVAMAFSADDNVLAGLVLNLINSVFSIVIGIGITKIYVALTRREKSQLSDLFSEYRLFFKYFFSSFLNSLMVIGGLLLFIVPGVYWAVQFSQYSYLVVDKKMGPIEALKESAKLTKGVKWELLGFIIVAFLINMLGLMFFVVGIFLTSIVTSLAFTHVYQQLLDQENPSTDQASAQVVSPAPTVAPVTPTPNTEPVPNATPEPDTNVEQVSKPDTETKPTD